MPWSNYGMKYYMIMAVLQNASDTSVVNKWNIKQIYILGDITDVTDWITITLGVT